MPSDVTPSPFAPDPAFWSGKRVLLTGHTGFKGSWLALWLNRLGARVRGYALAPDTRPNMFDALEIAELCEHVVGDLRSKEDLDRAIKAFEPEVVFHLAAQSIVRTSYRNPLETFEINVQGTANLLEACRNLPSLRSVVIVTSDKCYENRNWEWGYRETDRLGGSDPYSASKACAEMVVTSFRRSFFAEDGENRAVAIASARAGNVIGGGDWCADRLLPDAARSFLRKEVMIVRNPDSVRPWQHVLEPLAGYLMLARACYEKGRPFADGWNFGPPVHMVHPVSEVVTTFASLWGDGVRWQVQSDAAAPREEFRLMVDAARATRKLGWQTHLSLAEALALTAAWYRAFGSKLSLAALRDLTDQQLSDYMRHLAVKLQ
jgi:CDP-glucose 4,6-dehydratase